MPPSFVAPPVAQEPSVREVAATGLRRPGGRRALSVLSLLLALAGVGVFAWPVGTDAFSRWQQGQLAQELAAPEQAQAYATRSVAVGESLTRMVIPGIGVDVVVVEGTTPAALRAGAGHYPTTPLPGEVGNVAIAGHRTTYGRPLNRMDELQEGDVVELHTPFAVHRYRATAGFGGHGNPWVVAPTQTDVVAQDQAEPGARLLTLTTCHPKGSARQRLIMRFELVETRPLAVAS